MRHRIAAFTIVLAFLVHSPARSQSASTMAEAGPCDVSCKVFTDPEGWTDGYGCVSDPGAAATCFATAYKCTRKICALAMLVPGDGFEAVLVRSCDVNAHGWSAVAHGTRTTGQLIGALSASPHAARRPPPGDEPAAQKPSNAG